MSACLIKAQGILCAALVIAGVAQGARVDLQRAHTAAVFDRIVRVGFAELLGVFEPLNGGSGSAGQAAQQFDPDTGLNETRSQFECKRGLGVGLLPQIEPHLLKHATLIGELSLDSFFFFRQCYFFN